MYKGKVHGVGPGGNLFTDSFRIVIWRPSTNEQDKIPPPGPVNGLVNVPVNVPINVPINVPVKASLAEQIYALVKEHPGLNRVSIAEMMRVDVRTVGRQVSALRGRIEFRGAPKTGGYYAV